MKSGDYWNKKNILHLVVNIRVLLLLGFLFFIKKLSRNRTVEYLNNGTFKHKWIQFRLKY